jgi:hypothetical protein
MIGIQFRNGEDSMAVGVGVGVPVDVWVDVGVAVGVGDCVGVGVPIGVVSGVGVWVVVEVRVVVGVGVGPESQPDQVKAPTQVDQREIGCRREYSPRYQNVLPLGSIVMPV